jgi:serine/threonine protein kinase
MIPPGIPPVVTPYEILRHHGYQADPPSGIWLRVTRQALPSAGWKLHITATPANYTTVLHHALPRLHNSPAFKIVHSPDTLEDLNDGRYGLTQVGKAITVYTRNESEAQSLGAALSAVLKEASGPAIVTDTGYWGDEGPVFYRYGSFDGAYRVNELARKVRTVQLPDGSTADDLPGARHVHSTLLPTPTEIDTLAFLRHHYLFVQVLHLSAKGAVLAAIHKERPHAGVQIIKTARRHAQSDPFGRDALWALHREARFSSALPALPGIPAHTTTIDSPDGKAAALIRPYLDGEPFAIVWQSPDARTRTARNTQVNILREATTLLQRLHKAGYAFRDFSPGNLLVADSSAHLLDFELAHALSDPAPPYRRGTRGFYDERRERHAAPTPADDYYALLAWALMLHTGVHPEWLPPEQVLQEAPQSKPATPFHAAYANAAAAIDAPERFWPAYHSLLDAVPEPSQPYDAPPHPPAPIESRFAPYLRHWLEATPHPWIALDRSSVFGGLAGILLAAAEQTPHLLSPPLVGSPLRHAVHERLTAAAQELLHVPGYYFGAPGIGAALIQSGHLLQETRWIDTGTHLIAATAWETSEVPDLCHGLAGYIAARVQAAQSTHDQAHTHAALYAAHKLLGMQSADGSFPWPAGPHTGLSGEKQYGMAHGTAGVVWTLTGLYEATGDDSLLPAIHAGVGFILRGARPLKSDDGRHALWWPVSESDDRCWNAWSHGTPGVAIALTRAAAVCEAARESLLPAALGITLANNPGYCLCHGIASRLEAYTAVLHVQRDAVLEAEARRDAALLAGLPLAALEARANPEAGDDGYGLMKGAAGVWRALLRWHRLEELLQH